MNGTTPIRPLESTDIDACAAIVGSSAFFHSAGYTEEASARELGQALQAENMDLRVSTDGDRVMGFSWVVIRGAFDRSAYLRLLAVDEGCLRAGVGRALMAALEQQWLQRGDLFLLVTETNKRARSFYEVLGYSTGA